MKKKLLFLVLLLAFILHAVCAMGSGVGYEPIDIEDLPLVPGTENLTEGAWILVAKIEKEKIDCSALLGVPFIYVDHVFEFIMTKYGGADPSGTYDAQITAIMTFDTQEAVESLLGQYADIVPLEMISVEVNVEAITHMEEYKADFARLTEIPNDSSLTVKDSGGRVINPRVNSYVHANVLSLEYDYNEMGGTGFIGVSPALSIFFEDETTEMTVYIQLVIIEDDPAYNDFEFKRGVDVYVMLPEVYGADRWISGTGWLTKIPK